MTKREGRTERLGRWRELLEGVHRPGATRTGEASTPLSVEEIEGMAEDLEMVAVIAWSGCFGPAALRRLVGELLDGKLPRRGAGTPQEGGVDEVAGTPDREGRPVTGEAPTGADLIAAERARQVGEEGFGDQHDGAHSGSLALARAAACYATPEGGRRYRPRDHRRVPVDWPFAAGWWRPGDRVRELSKAGALCAAEIDRILRARRLGEGPGGTRETHRRTAAEEAEILAVFHRVMGGRFCRSCSREATPPEPSEIREAGVPPSLSREDCEVFTSGTFDEVRGVIERMMTARTPGGIVGWEEDGDGKEG